jgi:hypothetical protein
VVRHRGGSRRDPTVVPKDLVQLGRSLRRARVSQGMAVHDAARRSGLSFAQIEGLESGNPRGLPNQVETVNLLRRYAAVLGLPADRYALALLDAWPSARAPVVHQPGPVTARMPLDAPTASGGVPAVSGGNPRQAAVDRQPATGVLPATGTNGVSANGAPPTTRADAFNGNGHRQATASTRAFSPPLDTGPRSRETEAFPEDVEQEPRFGRLVLLRVLIGFLALLIVLGGAGLAIHHFEPQWLRSVEHRGNGNAHATSTTAPSAAGASGAVHVTTSSPASATIAVHGSGAVVRVSSVGGTSWTLVSQNGSGSPLFAADLSTGQSRDFPLSGALSVQFGASSGEVTVLIGQKVVQTYHPPTAPYTVTFQPS